MRLLLLIYLFTTCYLANAQTHEWSVSFGNTYADYVNAASIDENNNVFVYGDFNGTIDLDPGVGVQNVTSINRADAYIQKLDSNGNLVWFKILASRQNVFATTSNLDHLGNVYLCGLINDTVDFDPNAGVYNIVPPHYGTAYILKLDSLGNFQSVFTILSSAIGNASIYNIVIDSLSNMYLYGRYFGTVDFDPGVAVLNKTGNGLFLMKLDSSGNFQWVNCLNNQTTSKFDAANTIKLGENGNIYIGGYFKNSVDFDPTAGTNIINTNNFSFDAFIQKYNPSGNLLWTKIISGARTESIETIEINSKGDLCIMGQFSNTVDFDPGPATYNLTSNLTACFILKLDSLGNFKMAKSFGDNLFPMDMVVNKLDQIYITGSFSNTQDFDPGIQTDNKTSNGFSDIFINKLDSEGNYIRATVIGSAKSDIGAKISSDWNGDIFLVSRFSDTVDFDPGASTSNLISYGKEDISIARYSQCIGDTGDVVITECDNYTWINGINYTSSVDSVFHTISTSFSCDSTVMLSLTINKSSSSFDTIRTCDSVTWINGITYYLTTNSISDTLTNSLGCDSIIYLDLTILNNNSIDLVSACSPFVWSNNIAYYSNNNTAQDTLINSNGCDSIVSLNLTILDNQSTELVSACNSYTWSNNITYYSSNNTAKDTLTNSNGCDSVVTLNLTIDSIDTSISVNNYLLISNELAANYQWLDCNVNYQAIVGETNSSYIVTSNGNYAVEVRKNGCVDTSLCIPIVNVGNRGIYLEDKTIEVYPNPTNGDIFIKSKQNSDSYTLNLFNSHGQLILSNENTTDSYEYRINGPAGIYILKVESQHKTSFMKIIKN